MRIKVKYVIGSLFLLFFVIMFITYNFSVALNDVYEKDYTIENVLSDYQFIVKENADINNHCVGGMLVGGTANVSSFGDGAIQNSYFNNLQNYGNYSNSQYLKHTKYYKEYKCFYSKSKYSYDELIEQSKDHDFIDFNLAFDKFEKQSKDYNGYEVSRENIHKETIDGQEGYALYLDFSYHNNFIINEKIWDKIDFIKLTNISLKELLKEKHMITILSKEITIGGDYSYVETNNKEKAIFINNKLFDTGNGFLHFKTSGSIENGQMNLNGMKFIWNMPYATKVETTYLGGHVVAPLAEVEIKGGNFEGSYIAKSIKTNAEAHFYPYNKIEPIEDIPKITDTPKPKRTESPQKTPIETKQPKETEKPKIKVENNTTIDQSEINETKIELETQKPEETITENKQTNPTERPKEIAPNTLASVSNSTIQQEVTNEEKVPTKEFDTDPTNTPNITQTPIQNKKQEKVKLPDNRVPKSSMENPNKTTKIEDNKVPLSDMVPKTGDQVNLPIAFIILASSILAIILLMFIKHKK